MDLTRRVIVALDFDTEQEACAVVERLGDRGRAYKIGPQLLTTPGRGTPWTRCAPGPRTSSSAAP
ncbi:hypothetical protein Daura_28990 [Dactylosporangium aurantiacum]|uniref:Orotidine 5'-phosphate decarboxylase n=1 Tax=Dactylosporangium aurantiacum TaxID=35754 RepID=A0A9Q9MCE5_9ACTN|nr:hypothetical protein [Dactylosporangium aurantiacum]MDG6106690.1 hypothetical protein [Dactylosporangium aurantiacum]UWZ50844.1 hypothetical protein Daura_28990 [Dactylosporangium aurantiacum]